MLLLVYCSIVQHMQIVAIQFMFMFYMVPHKCLLHKLSYHVIRDETLVWINNFLSSCCQSLVLDGIALEKVNIISGVPQGIVLGPLLFLVNDVSDLPNSLKSTVHLFADDCILYRSIKSIHGYNVLQQDLLLLTQWEKTWQIQCYAMSITHKKVPFVFKYSMNNSTPEHVKNYSYLVVTNNLAWSNHIHKVVRKTNHTLCLRSHNFWSCKLNAKEVAHMSLVHQQREYASSVWDPYHQGQINDIEMIQRCAA